MNPNLNCVVLSGNSADKNSDSTLFNFTSEFFVAYWNSHFKNLGVSKKIDLSEFSQQQRVVGIFSGSRVVAMLTLNKHCMKFGVKRSSYFSQFSSDFLSVLSKMNLESAQSVQWLMVNRELAQEYNGLPLAEIIIAIALKYQIFLGLDASLACARLDNACAHVAQKLGFVMHGQPVQMYNSPIAQLVCQAPRASQKPEVASLVDRLWQQRTDNTLEVAMQREAA
jgi:hypothetical protein